MPINWLDRRTAAPGPHLCLVLSEKAYLAAMAELKIQYPEPWVEYPSHATTYLLEHSELGCVAVIGMREWEGRDPIEVAGLLVHEAVHVWQAYAERIGENNPGAEQEAYGIQAISQELLAEFARQTAGSQK